MKIPTTIQLTENQFSLLRKKAEQTGNSISSIIRTAIDDHLKNNNVGGLDVQ